ncbi:MAG: hypothetical protein ACRDK4_04960 [Solirubrobacteraceae bacterium]
MRDVTRFPNGVSDEGQTRKCGRHSITGTATIATGLDEVEGATATLETVSVTATHGFVVTAKASATPGDVDIAVFDLEGKASTVAVEVNWTAFGPA